LLLLEMDGFPKWARNVDSDEVDRFLRSIGSTLRPVVRRTDLLARIDETRFAIGLLDCNLAGAVLVADRVDGLLDPFRQATGLAFSQGGASYDMDMRRPEDLLAAAGAALEAALRQGPNQMEFSR
jgi:GGDEF domain-containing protein